MSRVNWPVVDSVHPKDNKFVTGLKIKATVDSKLNDSLELRPCLLCTLLLKTFFVEKIT